MAVKESQLKDSLALVATQAHELCHLILLGPGLLSGDDPDMEPLTDLATVYLGMGVFAANSARRFEHHQAERKDRLVHAHTRVFAGTGVWIRAGKVRARTRREESHVGQASDDECEVRLQAVEGMAGRECELLSIASH